MELQRQSIGSTNSSSGSLLLQMQTSEVVKRGCLYVKRPPSDNPVKFRFKTWQKRYLVLRDMLTEDGDSVLEMYNNEAAANSSVDEPGSRLSTDAASVVGAGGGGAAGSERCFIRLRDVVYVGDNIDSRSFPHAFIVLRTAKCPVIFGAKTELEMREWLMAVKLLADKVNRLRTTAPGTDGTLGSSHTDGDIRRPPPRVEKRCVLRKDDVVHRSTPLLLDNSSPRSSRASNHRTFRPAANDSKRKFKDHDESDSNSKFLVSVQRTEDSASHRLNGDYYMVVREKEISLRPISASDSNAAIAWPLRFIRKLKSEGTNDGHGDLITLVANSHCDQAQGTYKFRITSGLDLIRRVRMLAKSLESADSCCRQQQRDIAKLKGVASSSPDKLSSSSLQETGSGCQSMQSLVMSSGGSSSGSGSQLDQSEEFPTSAPRQSHVYCFTGNSYLPIVDDISGGSRSSNQALVGQRMMTLSRSMGSLGLLSTTTRQIDSGFESSEEAVTLNVSPPIVPPRPVHTIGHT